MIDKELFRHIAETSGHHMQDFMEVLATAMGDPDQVPEQRFNLGSQFADAIKGILAVTDGKIDDFITPETTKLACDNMLANGALRSLSRVKMMLQASNNSHHIPGTVYQSKALKILLLMLPAHNHITEVKRLTL